MVIDLIRQLLKTSNAILYKNNSGATVQVTGILLCNTANVQVPFYLYITDNETTPLKGAICHGLLLDPNETITLPNRYMKNGDVLMAYAGVINKVSLLADVEKM